MSQVLDILQVGDPILRKICVPVTTIDDELLNFLADMKETLKQGGIGLAAPQVGRAIQLVTIDIPLDDISTTYICINGERKRLADIMPFDFINPEITPYGPKAYFTEGCLSIQDVYERIRRRSKIRGTFTLLDGTSINLECNGLLARCIQHECDHLKGILFTDRIGQEPD